VVGLAGILIGSALLFATLEGWQPTLLPRSEWGFGRTGLAVDGVYSVEIRDNVRLGFFGVKRWTVSPR
jgi:hypothetical protein